MVDVGYCGSEPTRWELFEPGSSMRRRICRWGILPSWDDGGDATRTCTVPADTALFFPVVNSFITGEEDAYPECAADFVDSALANGEPYATLDGKNLKMRRIATGPFTLTVPENNIFGAPAGPYTAVSDGLWVYLPQGLEPGEYTVQFGGDFGDVTSLNITYELIVV